MKSVTVTGSVRQLNLSHDRYEMFNHVEKFSNKLQEIKGIVKDSESRRLTDVELNQLRRMYFIQFDFLPHEVYLRIDLTEKSNGIRDYSFKLKSIGNNLNGLHAQWLLTAIQTLFVKDFNLDYSTLKLKLLGVEIPPNRLINMNDYQSTP